MLARGFHTYILKKKNKKGKTMQNKLNNLKTVLPDGQTVSVSDQTIADYASMHGIESLIHDRYSSLFVFQLMLNERISGLDPQLVIAEIKHLEGIGPPTQTKPESAFRGNELKGLWHKHFFVNHPSAAAHNILAHLGNNGLERMVNEVFDPNKSAVITNEMINELSNRLVEGSLTERADAGKLTGEWIIFAKEQGKNYYLSINTHENPDEKTAKSIKQCCIPEFPFLSNYFISKT